MPVENTSEDTNAVDRGSSLVQGQSSPLSSKGRGPTGIVTVVSLSMSGKDDLNKRCTSDIIDKFFSTYRELLSRCVRDFRGFIVASNQDEATVVFQQPWDALNCCLTIQTAFIASSWPDEILSLASCARVEEPRGMAGKTLVFNGPRLQIGVSRGKLESEYDFAASRTKYRGNELHVSLEISKLAKGGQILANTAAWGEVQRSQLSPCFHNDTGRHKIDKCERKQRLYEVLPSALAERSKWFGTTCSNCGDKIRPDQGYIKALGRHWHLKHFRCCHCNNPLMDSYIVKDGMPYCLDDFFTLHARTCHGCDTIITGSYIEAMSNYWHPDCFVCQKCKRAPEGSENIYELNALPFCLKCYHEVSNSVHEAHRKAQHKTRQSPVAKPVRADELKHRTVIKS